VPFIPPSIPFADMDARQQAQFFAQAGVQATGTGSGGGVGGVRTFTPTNWIGFGASPPSDISYIDLGAVVMVWGGVLGTSDATGFGFEFLPASIRPTVERDTTVFAHDNGVIVLARADVLTNGSVIFYRSNVAAAPGPVSFTSSTTWTAAGQKGLVGSFIYPK
jgi:hypothetical protein